MEFWGVEVKAGEPLKVKPDDESIIHLSQAALGESKKDKENESVTLFVKVNDKKMVLGTLLSENIPQLSFDLVFEKEVELSHNWKNGSVYFCGYQSILPDEEEDFALRTMFSDEDSEDEVPIPLANVDNGAVQVKTGAKPATVKADAAKPDSSKQKAKPAQSNKDIKADDDSDDDDDESDDDEEEDEEDGSDGEDESEEGMSVDEDSDEEDDSESEDEETPKKVGKGNKRPNDSVIKTPVPSKKQKAASPQNTDGKKGGGHTATPHPAKGLKASANGSNNKAPQTLKTGGKFSCGSCDRSFGSDAALQSHSKAKHNK